MHVEHLITKQQVLVCVDGTVIEFKTSLELYKILDNMRRWIDLTTLGPLYYYASTMDGKVWQ